jgi:hypothetical protein
MAIFFENKEEFFEIIKRSLKNKGLSFVKSLIESEIINWVKNPESFKPAIENIIVGKIKKIYEKEIKKILKVPRLDNFVKITKLIKYILEVELNAYIVKTFSNISEKSSKVQEKTKTWKSVFLIGAGTSYESGLPLTSTLNDLLKFVKAKNYQELQNNQKKNKKCKRFKEEFKKICEKSPIGVSHKIIALNFPQYIKEIICLNWDNLIEKAFNECNKKIEKINRNDNIKVEVKDIEQGGYLWKFHGDVEEPDYKWIFPNHRGRVFKNFIDYYKRNNWLKDNLFVFVIVGYSEKEKNISDNLIKLLEKRRKHVTYRIGLEFKRFHHKNYIFGPADVVLELILPKTEIDQVEDKLQANIVNFKTEIDQEQKNKINQKEKKQ